MLNKNGKMLTFDTIKSCKICNFQVNKTFAFFVAVNYVFYLIFLFFFSLPYHFSSLNYCINRLLSRIVYTVKSKMLKIRKMLWFLSTFWSYNSPSILSSKLKFEKHICIYLFRFQNLFKNPSPPPPLKIA